MVYKSILNTSSKEWQSEYNQIKAQSKEKQNQVYISNSYDKIAEEEKQKQELNVLIYGENGILEKK